MQGWRSTIDDGHLNIIDGQLDLIDGHLNIIDGPLVLIDGYLGLACIACIKFHSYIKLIAKNNYCCRVVYYILPLIVGGVESSIASSRLFSEVLCRLLHPPTYFRRC